MGGWKVTPRMRALQKASRERFFSNPANREKKRAYERARRKRPDVHARLMEAQKRRYKGNNSAVAEWNLRKKYGIGLAEYESMMQSQGGVCAICRGENQIRTRMHVDHCHVTGKVRGLLCGPCNRGLGLFGESSERLSRAANYLGRE